ncbi:MAG: hypothetical protein K1X65_25100 [Caldilineales bacterium]|nr:hypothetical protein [Caldilineales bacterium]
MFVHSAVPGAVHPTPFPPPFPPGLPTGAPPSPTMENLSKTAAITIEALKDADNEALTGAGVDMAGYDSVAFVVGALEGEALNFSIKAQQAAAANFSDAADLAGTATTFATTIGAKGLAVLDIRQPAERYLRAVVTVPNATAATPTFCIAIRYNARTLPQTNDGELHTTPAEGTA